MMERDAMDLPPLPETAALIVVDVQQGLDDPVWGRRNNPDAEANIGRLLAAWRRTHRPIFHIQHRSRLATSPLRPGQRGFDLKEIGRPQAGEPLLTKEVNSAFIGTDLAERLRRIGCTTVVVTGLTTNHCVETTTRMAGNLDFTTFIVSDATATFDRIGPDGAHYAAELIHAVSLASLHGEFATVVTTGTLLASLAQHVR